MRKVTATMRPGPAAPVAAFDLDGTITCHDTLRLALRRGIRAGFARPAAAFRLPGLWLAARRDLARRGAFKAAALDLVFGGQSRARLEAFAAAFVCEVLRSEVKPGAQAAIARHRGCGHTLVLATASPDLWAGPIGAALGFDVVLATKLAWQDEKFAGRLDGPNLLHDAKRRAVEAFLAEHAGGVRLHAGYTDHHHDLPMLLLAQHPVAVDPTAELAAAAAARQIPIETWR